MSVSASDIISFAKTALGTPYQWGGNSMSGGIDCSGLVQQVFQHFGIDLPRVTYDQYKVGAQVSYSQLQPGDLMFFDDTSQGPGHVGIYIGGGQMIEAAHTGTNVRITDVTQQYYRDAFVGGRRVAGVQGGGQYDPSMGSTGLPLQPTAATTQSNSILSPEDLASSYGWAYSFLQSQPDVQNVFQQAVSGNWTAQKFQAEIQNTSWWRTTQESARQVEITKSTDPATYQAQLNSALANVTEKAHSMGAYPSDGELQKIAKDGLQFGLDDAQLTNILANYVKFYDKHLGGTSGQIEDKARQVAYDNGVQLTDEAIKTNAIMIAKGQKSMEQYVNDIRNQAIGMFPAYKDQLKAGQTVAQIAQPYMDAMSTLLEKDPSSLSVFDPTIKKALNGLNQQGQPTGMSLSDFETMIRQQPAWQQTNNAQTSVMQGANTVLTQMGLGF